VSMCRKVSTLSKGFAYDKSLQVQCQELQLRLFLVYTSEVWDGDQRAAVAETFLTGGGGAEKSDDTC
jgi:hypothetical protein